MTEDEIKVAFASKVNMKVPGTKEDLKRFHQPVISENRGVITK